MWQSYVKPMLSHQAVERFGVRIFLQEHLLDQKPVVSPEVLLKSDASLEKQNVLDNIFKEVVPGEPHNHGHWHWNDDPHHGYHHGVLRGFWHSHSHCHVHKEKGDADVPDKDVHEEKGDADVPDKDVQANVDGRFEVITAATDDYDPPDCEPPEIQLPEALVDIIETATTVGLAA